MKILCTGGAGFIGSFLVDELIRMGHEVRIYDNIEPQVHPGGEVPDYLNKDAEFIREDVLNYDALAKAVEDVDIICHDAAMVGVGQSMYQIKRYMETNTLGTANLLDILVNRKNKVRKLIVASSMSTYGEGAYLCPACGPVSPPLRPVEQMDRGDFEVHCPNCGEIVQAIPTPESKFQEINSYYALAKKDQEDMVMLFGQTYGLPVIALRRFNVFGPRQSLSNPYTGVAAIFMSRLMNDHRPIVFEDGLQSRDFISVHDIVRANIMVMESEKADQQIYNVGAGRQITVLEIAQTLGRLLGKDIEPDIVGKFRKGDVRHCFADISKIKGNLGFEPRVSLEDGFRELIEWSKNTSANDMGDRATEELREKGLVG
ncbi:MAG: GDP-mannose 4,6-dehydratase [Candidatus Euphemobacter frigidus]|nr:GDP-mannose 4,6-dehydratase [Candidatus Euphemobacter frigidus]MDP8275491.1 GDP-mannose 4,6-dehydratase [Candidatus Euphemobacter frigidus]